MKQQVLYRIVVHTAWNRLSWPVLKKVDTFREETFADEVDPQNLCFANKCIHGRKEKVVLEALYFHE